MSLSSETQRGRHGVFPPGGCLENCPRGAGADLLDHAGAGDAAVHPRGAMRGAAALGSSPVAPGGGLRGPGDRGRAGGGAGAQRVAGHGCVGLLKPPRQSVGPDLPTVCGPLVGAVPGLYPGL